MKVLAIGTLSSVTGASFGSGVSSSPIALFMERNLSDAYLWASIEGDTGRTGGSICIFWKGCYSKSGVTYASPNNEFLIKGGTSVAGAFGNGSYLVKFQPGMPFIRIEAIVSKSGSTQHGTGTTNTVNVKWGISAV